MYESEAADQESKKRKGQKKARGLQYAPLSEGLEEVPAKQEIKRKCYKILKVCILLLVLVLVLVVVLLGTLPETLDKLLSYSSSLMLPRCQLNAALAHKGGHLAAKWHTDKCKKFFSCRQHDNFLIDRTCTREDANVYNNVPQPRAVDILIARAYGIAYVLNPSNVDDLVQYIMQKFLGAVVIDSHKLTLDQIATYFIFTFVDDPVTRFIAKLAQNTTETCQNVEEHTRQAIGDKSIHTQAFFFSGDAGKTNKAIKLNWIGNATDVQNVNVLLNKIQAKLGNYTCLPEIDFLEINFEFLQKKVRLQKIRQHFHQCLSTKSIQSITEYYKQDSQCFV